MQEELVPIAELRPHPKNYQVHPPDELEHIKASIADNGIYKNIVIAEDGTILAGHGVTEAAEDLGFMEVPARRLPISSESPQALKILAGDNEIRHLAIIDDRALTNILQEIDDYTNLLGTGYDDMMLANLDAVTRPPDDLRKHNEADHWVGLPEYAPAEQPFKLIIQFESDDERQEFIKMIGADTDARHTMIQSRYATSMLWPLQVNKVDRSNVRFEAG